MRLRREIRRAVALGLRIPVLRQLAITELAASLRVIADVGARYDQDHSGEELLRRSPLLRKPIEQISDEIADETNEEIKQGFRLLRPYAVKGFGKARFGNPHDGGYVILDDLDDIDTAFSFGIDKDATWDLEISRKNVTVYQFDHTIDFPPVPNNPR